MRASSAAMRASCCWMTASSWTTTWRTPGGVCSQLAASSGSPIGSGIGVATVPSHVTPPEALQAQAELSRERLKQCLGLSQVSGVKAFGKPAVAGCQHLTSFSVLALVLP